MANTVAELIFIPAPVIGHIISTIELAKLLVNRDQRLSITVLIIKPPSVSRSVSAVTTYIETLANNAIERIRFIDLPQDETLPNRDPKAPMNFVNDFINSHCKYVRKVVADIINQPSGSGQIAGFIIDMLCTGMIDVANEFNVPTYVFFTSNAAYLGFQFYIQTLCDDDQNQNVIELTNSDSVIPVPVFVNPVPTKVFPSGFDTKGVIDYVLLVSRKMREAKAIIVNTFLELETHAIDSLSSDVSIPRVYPVGPVLNPEGVNNSGDDVITWLDGQPPSSVILLCFGSLGCFNEVQVKEIAHALEQSGHRFVWSLRRPPSPDQISQATSDYDDPRVVLPEGFLERTAGIGIVVGWVPQVAVLAHSAVGGFVNHCGWNSTLESLWFGVPMATWPIYAEQQMNAFEMVVELGLAVEIKFDYKKDLFNPESDIDIVTAREIEIGIKRLMDDNEIRDKMKEMGKMSRETVREGGSSYAYLASLIHDFISNIR